MLPEIYSLINDDKIIEQTAIICIFLPLLPLELQFIIINNIWDINNPKNPEPIIVINE